MDGSLVHFLHIVIFDRLSAKRDCENYRRDKNRLDNLFACQIMLQERHVCG